MSSEKNSGSVRFSNVYDDRVRADAYSRLEFPGTYFLAYRDLPELIREHVRGQTALDFGCGTGRSTRFLRGLGFDPVGVDISASMLERARELDALGDYRLISDGDLSGFDASTYDLVLSAFTFDNVPSLERKATLLSSLKTLLKPSGRFVNLVSTPEIYVNEWASFSTRDFPENRVAKSGDRVRIVMLDVGDRRPVEDVVCADEDYQRLYGEAGLRVVATRLPLGKPEDGIEWVSETSVAPWAIHLLAPVETRG